MLFSYKSTFIGQNARHSNPKHNELQLKMNYSYSYANQNNPEPYIAPYENNINTNQPKIKLYNNKLRVFDGIKYTKELTRMKRSCFTCG
jgi:hypothetical protein